MKKFFSARKLNIILSVSAIVLMWLVWIISYYSVKNDYIIPSFSATVKSFFLCFAESGFWIAFCMTALRTFAAFAVSFAAAALFAALSVSFKGASAFLKPIMVFLRTVPTLAVILVLLVWTNPEAAPVAVTFLVLFLEFFVCHTLISFTEKILSSKERILMVFKCSNFAVY